MIDKKNVSIIKTPVTWYLVADSRNAQIYTRQKTERMIPIIGNSRHKKFEQEIDYEMVAIPEMKWNSESPDQYQAGRNATGMVFESSGGARHMSEPHMDISDEVREHFAKAIAEKLERLTQEKSFDHLVLIAPPKMLGELIKHLSEKILKLVNEQIPKDFTHCTAKELTECLQHVA